MSTRVLISGEVQVCMCVCTFVCVCACACVRVCFCVWGKCNIFTSVCFLMCVLLRVSPVAYLPWALHYVSLMRVSVFRLQPCSAFTAHYSKEVYLFPKICVLLSSRISYFIALTHCLRNTALQWSDLVVLFIQDCGLNCSRLRTLWEILAPVRLTHALTCQWGEREKPMKGTAVHFDPWRKPTLSCCLSSELGQAQKEGRFFY